LWALIAPKGVFFENIFKGSVFFISAPVVLPNCNYLDPTIDSANQFFPREDFTAEKINSTIYLSRWYSFMATGDKITEKNTEAIIVKII
jgi:hypothetical protein